MSLDSAVTGAELAPVHRHTCTASAERCKCSRESGNPQACSLSEFVPADRGAVCGRDVAGRGEQALGPVFWVRLFQGRVVYAADAGELVQGTGGRERAIVVSTAGDGGAGVLDTAGAGNLASTITGPTLTVQPFSLDNTKGYPVGQSSGGDSPCLLFFSMAHGTRRANTLARTANAAD